MRRLLLALGLAAAATSAAAQSVMGDQAFFAQLGLMNEGIQASVKGARIAQLAPELTKDDALRLVLADLAGSGVPEAYVRAAFDDPAAVFYPDIPGKFKPTLPSQPETYDQYKKNFLTPERIRAGAEFYQSHRALLDSVEQRYGVDAGILAALVGVETYWGAHTGTYTVFGALYTITLKVPSRSAWAAKELAEWFRICHSQQIPVHGTKGSYAGAFGFFQFMPSSYNKFAVDFDGDGRKSWDSWPDALGSVGNYLALAGWETGGALRQGSRNYKAIYAYNHSDNYVRSIVDLRAEILKLLPVP